MEFKKIVFDFVQVHETRNSTLFCDRFEFRINIVYNSASRKLYGQDGTATHVSNSVMASKSCGEMFSGSRDTASAKTFCTSRQCRPKLRAFSFEALIRYIGVRS